MVMLVILKPHDRQRIFKYITVGLTKEKGEVQKVYRIHRLIATAFHTKSRK